MAAEDARVRAELAADGSLFDGYHPRMEEVHVRHATRLGELLAERRWPGRSLAGEDGAAAAFVIAQHAISLPAFQRRAREALAEAVAAGDAPGAQLAYLTDRIRVNEGRPQVYGTQFDWDEAGEMSPLPIEAPDGVDARRAALGLEPLADRTRRMRAEVAASNERPPRDLAARRREGETWARKVGWRD